MLQGVIPVDVKIEGIIFYIKTLSQQFGSVSFAFILRKCNEAAPLVAAFVSRVRGTHFWDLVWPEWLFDVLTKHVNLSIRL